MKFLTGKELNDFCYFADAKNHDEGFWKELEKSYLKVYLDDPLVLDHQRFTYFAQVNICFQYFSNRSNLA